MSDFTTVDVKLPSVRDLGWSVSEEKVELAMQRDRPGRSRRGFTSFLRRKKRRESNENCVVESLSQSNMSASAWSVLEHYPATDAGSICSISYLLTHRAPREVVRSLVIGETATLERVLDDEKRRWGMEPPAPPPPLNLILDEQEKGPLAAAALALPKESKVLRRSLEFKGERASGGGGAAGPRMGDVVRDVDAPSHF